MPSHTHQDGDKLFNLWLSEEARERLRQGAKEAGVSMSEYARRILDAAWAKQQGKSDENKEKD